ncbi:MAG TPA: hypothetical protein DHV36_02590 [Desulfobacteraceae bacterium]|nr:hypothetical protein [Desulfobacteraceae bacterium]|tara:strand:- start:618 stop:1265 length:648 start_codon:yes stop_codon:yes gene_type:complete
MNSILTTGTVAAELGLTEETIAAFGTKGILPGKKAEDSWQFTKEAVAEWKHRQLSAHPQGSQRGMDAIESVLRPERLLFTSLGSKKDLFSYLASRAVDCGTGLSEAETVDELVQRETLMSTGIGLGIAVPHLRLADVSAVELFLLLNDRPISDYGSIDDKAVEVILFIMVGTQMQAEYLRVLASSVNLLKNKTIREAALACTDRASAHRIITGKF